MTKICEGSLVFSFVGVCDTLKYDEWSFYRKRLQRIYNTKAVDILCITNDTAWLIEVKDYRAHNRKKHGSVEDEVAQKVRDTLAGLAAANANGDAGEQKIAYKALSKRRWRVVLHIEQASNLMSNISTTQIKLQQQLGAVDTSVLVTNTQYVIPQIPWKVRAQKQP